MPHSQGCVVLRGPILSAVCEEPRFYLQATLSRLSVRLGQNATGEASADHLPPLLPLALTGLSRTLALPLSVSVVQPKSEGRHLDWIWAAALPGIQQLLSQDLSRVLRLGDV